MAGVNIVLIKQQHCQRISPPGARFVTCGASGGSVPKPRVSTLLLLQCATTDIGPGTGTAMTQIAADALRLPPAKIRFDLGQAAFPQSGSQGGSSTVNTVGQAVQDACLALKDQLRELVGASSPAFASAKKEDVSLADGYLVLSSNAPACPTPTC